MIHRIAGGLLRKGVKQTDHVCIYSRNNIHYVPVVLGIIATGAVAVPIPASYKASKAADVIKSSSSAWMFADRNLPAIEAASMADLDESYVIHLDAKDNRKSEHGTDFSSMVDGAEVDFVIADPQTPTLILTERK